MRVSKLSLAAIAAGVALSMSATGLAAQEMSQDQDLDQEVTVNCTTGAYGQDSSCTVEADQGGSQSQRLVNELGQRIVYRADGTPIIVHDPIDTGLDFQTTAAAVSTMVLGATTAVINRKNRVA